MDVNFLRNEEAAAWKPRLIVKFGTAVLYFPITSGHTSIRPIVQALLRILLDAFVREDTGAQLHFDTRSVETVRSLETLIGGVITEHVAVCMIVEAISSHVSPRVATTASNSSASASVTGMILLRCSALLVLTLSMIPSPLTGVQRDSCRSCSIYQ